jgi:hypothetical protein
VGAKILDNNSEYRIGHEHIVGKDAANKTHIMQIIIVKTWLSYRIQF